MEVWGGGKGKENGRKWESGCVEEWVTGRAEVKGRRNGGREEEVMNGWVEGWTDEYEALGGRKGIENGRQWCSGWMEGNKWMTG